jgi:hypothetical protein
VEDGSLEGIGFQVLGFRVLGFKVLFTLDAFVSLLLLSPGDHLGHEADAQTTVLLLFLTLQLILLHLFCIHFTSLAIVSLCLPLFHFFSNCFSLFLLLFHFSCFLTWRPCWT